MLDYAQAFMNHSFVQYLVVGNYILLHPKV